MPTPAVTLKLRRFRRRFGIAAPRVTVRSHVPWPWYALGLLGIALLVAVVVWTAARQGEATQLLQEIAELRGRIEGDSEELQRLRVMAGTEQSAVQMERATQQRLIARIKALEAENAVLKEDIALFERLVPTDGDESTVRVDRLRITAEPQGGRYRYRLLVGFVASKQIREFKGHLQLVVTVLQGGREQVLTLPLAEESAADYLVEVRHFVRKEGIIVVPAGARLRSVEARLFQGDTLKAKRLVQF